MTSLCSVVGFMETNGKVKTLNGRPTPVTSLVDSMADFAESKPQGFLGRLYLCYQRLNQVLAGMYTGVTCYGVPQEEQSFSATAKQSNPDEFQKPSNLD